MGKTIEFNCEPLKHLIAALKNPPKVRVGVLGTGARSGDSGQSNAEVGARHEFGAEGMPIRSFLRMPLTEKLQQSLDQSKAFDDETLKEVAASGKLNPWMEKIGLIAEQIIAQAFRTGGFGKWKPSDMKRKKVHQTLVETQQLRNSIVSKVVTK